MTQGLEIIFHGATGTVTRSCMELVLGRRRILVDCGLFQGSRSLERLNFEPFRFRPATIDAVILTHAPFAQRSPSGGQREPAKHQDDGDYDAADEKAVIGGGVPCLRHAHRRFSAEWPFRRPLVVAATMMTGTKGRMTIANMGKISLRKPSIANLLIARRRDAARRIGCDVRRKRLCEKYAMSPIRGG
jgi:hypothetical protein